MEDTKKEIIIKRFEEIKNEFKERENIINLELDNNMLTVKAKFLRDEDIKFIKNRGFKLIVSTSALRMDKTDKKDNNLDLYTVAYFTYNGDE